jgi:hypothetical protein
MGINSPPTEGFSGWYIEEKIILDGSEDPREVKALEINMLIKIAAELTEIRKHLEEIHHGTG